MPLSPPAPAASDWHCHLLPGLDDGPRETAEALEMARLLQSAGHREVYCTPHCIKGSFETTPEQVRGAVAELQSALDAEGIDLKLHPGMEYYLDEFFPSVLDDPLLLGETNLLLVEAPSQADPEMLREHLFAVVRRGLVPLFAHPERYAFFALPEERRGFWAKVRTTLPSFLNLPSGPREEHEAHSRGLQLLTDLAAMGCRFQGNLGSFTGFYGEVVQRQARLIQRAGFYALYGSDGHSPRQLRAVLQTVP